MGKIFSDFQFNTGRAGIEYLSEKFGKTGKFQPGKLGGSILELFLFLELDRIF